MAIPAIGTGGFGYQVSVVAEEICNGIERCFKLLDGFSIGTTVKTVNIVLAQDRQDVDQLEQVECMICYNLSSWSDNIPNQCLMLGRLETYKTFGIWLFVP